MSPATSTYTQQVVDNIDSTARKLAFPIGGHEVFDAPSDFLGCNVAACDDKLAKDAKYGRSAAYGARLPVNDELMCRLIGTSSGELINT